MGRGVPRDECLQQAGFHHQARLFVSYREAYGAYAVGNRQFNNDPITSSKNPQHSQQ